MIPLPIRLTLDPSAVVVTQCSVDAVDDSKTNVEASYCVVAFKPFQIDLNVDQAGFDQARPKILACLTDQIADALRAAQ